MQNIRPFQIVLLGVFAVLAIISLVVLAGFEGSRSASDGRYGDGVVIWGTFDNDVFTRVFREIAQDDEVFGARVSYVEKDPRTFTDEFVNAIADGVAPDVVLIPHELLVTLRTKLRPLSYDAISERDFRDRYVDGAEIFLRADGVYAVPLFVDPLLMYYNRDLLSSAAIATPPRTWDRLVNETVPRTTFYNTSGRIVQSGIAFGEYNNVTYAKEILLTLLLQSGSRMVFERESQYVVALDTPRESNSSAPLQTSTRFYTDFSDPVDPLYSWDGSRPQDEQAFLGNELALYFAPASVYDQLVRGNPNLNIDATVPPQGANATVKRAYGVHYGLALVRASDNPNGSFAAVSTITQNDVARQLSELLGVAPAIRSVVDAGAGGAVRQTIYDAALVAYGWLDPNPRESDQIFSTLINDVVSGRARISEASRDAEQRLELVF